MKFRNNPSIDDVLNSLSASNQAKMSYQLSATLSVLCRVLSCVLKIIPGIKIMASPGSPELTIPFNSQAFTVLADELQHEDTIPILEKYRKCREDINMGDKHNSDWKDKAFAGLFYYPAMENAENILIKANSSHKRLFVNLFAEARSKYATSLFYANRYTEANNLFRQAETDLSEAGEKYGFEVEGLNDKELEVKTFHIPCFAALTSQQIREGEIDVDEVYPISDSLFGKITADVVYNVERRSSHTTHYVLPLSNWIDDHIVNNKLNLPDKYLTREQLRNDILRADRLTYLVNSGKLLNNRGWLELYFYNISHKYSHLVQADNFYKLGMSSLVDGYCRDTLNLNKISTTTVDKYCNSPFFSNKVQISIARNCIYRLAISKLANNGVGVPGTEIERLNQLLAKESSNYEVRESINTSINNLGKIGLGEVAEAIHQELPPALVESIPG